MEQNIVYELAKNLQQNQGIETEVQEMLFALKNSVEKNYLQKASALAQTQKNICNQNPPKEVILLRALSPFLGSVYEAQIASATQSLMLLQSMRSIGSNIENITHRDGLLETRSSEQGVTYPSPETTTLAGILLALSMMDTFKPLKP